MSLPTDAWLTHNASEYTINGKTYRNLEAQVLKNMLDIEDINGRDYTAIDIIKGNETYSKMQEILATGRPKMYYHLISEDRVETGIVADMQQATDFISIIIVIGDKLVEYKVQNDDTWNTIETKYAETTNNKVTSITSSSTNTQYPSAKAVYDDVLTYAQAIGENVTEIEADLSVLDGEALKKPSSAPASYKIIGVNTSGEEVFIDVGNGLSIYNNKLDSKSNFTASYNSTTFATISQKMSEGYNVVCNFDDIVLNLVYDRPQELWFSSVKDSTIYVAKILSDNTWSITQRIIEVSSNKVTSITSSSTDTQYPTAKAVYDLVIGAIEEEY